MQILESDYFHNPNLRKHSAPCQAVAHLLSGKNSPIFAYFREKHLYVDMFLT